MNLRDLLGAMRRRWYLVLVGLVLTGAMCLGAMQFVPAHYKASATVLLLPPSSTVGAGGNPYLSLGGLRGAVDVLGRAMLSEQTTKELTNGSTEETYTLEADATTNAPMLVLDVNSQSAEGALALMQSVLNRAPTVLSDLQAEVKAPTKSLVTLSVIARDSTAETDTKSQIRALIVALAAGLAFTVFFTILVDAGFRRRSTRKPAQPAQAPPPPTHGPPAGQEPGGAPPRRVRSGLRAPTTPTADRIK